MSLNRNAAGLKSQRRLDREIFRREESQGRWSDMHPDSRSLPARPQRGILHAVPDALEQQVFWHANTCLNCWSLIIPTNAAPVDYGNNTHVWIQSTASGVKGSHPALVYQEQYEMPDEPEWIHASTAHRKCYRDAGCVATFMPGIYVIEEMDI